MMDPRDIESVERVIPQPAEAIFALLADPSRHYDIDGSGTLRGIQTLPGRVQLGDSFSMAMNKGGRYTTRNTVVEFDDNRSIAWRPSATGLYAFVGEGPTWRYELEPVGTGTRVRETRDLSSMQLLRPFARLPKARRNTRAGMEKTLENIEKLLANS